MMIARIPNGLKIAALLLALPLILWFSTLRKTVQQYGELKRLEKVLLPNPIDENTYSIPQENQLLGNYLFAQIFGNAIEEGCELVAYSPHCDKTESNISLYRCQIVAKGQFVPLLRIVNHLEHEPELRISRLRFYRKDKKLPMVFLEVELIQLVRDD